MIQVILTREHLRLFGDLRHVHVSMGACLARLDKGRLTEAEAIERIREQVAIAETLWRKLAEEGV
jgi:hypothetical protein